MSSAAHSDALKRLCVSSRELVFFEGEGHVRDLGSAGDLSRLLSSERKQRAEAAMQFSGSEQCSVRVHRSAVRSIGLGIVCDLFYPASSCRFISECFCFCSLYLEALVRLLQP